MVLGNFRGKEFYIVSIQTGSKEPWHYENNNIVNLFLVVENIKLVLVGNGTFDGT